MFASATEEQQISNATAVFGRMVALGSPSDALPQVGAGRDYVGDGEWRARVLAGLARARLVLLVASPGRAVLWEAERVIEGNLADRLILLITGDGRSAPLTGTTRWCARAGGQLGTAAATPVPTPTATHCRSIH